MGKKVGQSKLYVIIKVFLMSNLFDMDNDRIFNQIWTNCEISPQPNYTQQQPLFRIQQQNPQNNTEPVLIASLSQVKRQQSSSSKQCNPNLLKNLVVTLRSWVRLVQGKHGKYEVELWKYFKNCKKINKNLVWSLYGNIEEQPNYYQKLRQQVPALREVSLLQFKGLQKIVINETVTQLKKADMEYILKYRRVKDREEFNKYFYDFVQKLESGVGFPRKNK